MRKIKEGERERERERVSELLDLSSSSSYSIVASPYSISLVDIYRQFFPSRQLFFSLKSL